MSVLNNTSLALSSWLKHWTCKIGENTENLTEKILHTLSTLRIYTYYIHRKHDYSLIELNFISRSLG